METCDICGETLQGPEVDSRQEWVEEQYHCENCGVDFTKRTDFHIQSNIPASIRMTRDWHESDEDYPERHEVVVYAYTYDEEGKEDQEKITHEEIKELILNRGLNVDEVIDAVIEINGIMGVGLVTLGDQLKGYVTSKM